MATRCGQSQHPGGQAVVTGQIGVLTLNPVLEGGQGNLPKCDPEVGSQVPSTSRVVVKNHLNNLCSNSSAPTGSKPLSSLAQTVALSQLRLPASTPAPYNPGPD